MASSVTEASVKTLVLKFGKKITQNQEAGGREAGEPGGPGGMVRPRA